MSNDKETAAMSDTPRTDELELNFQRDNLDTHLKLVLALRFAEKLERENAALRAEVNVTRKNYEEYKTENITLREDSERMTFLLNSDVRVPDGVDWYHFRCRFDVDTLMDIRRKEAQP